MQSEILIIGFGNQAKAWALNLRDEGFRVVVALRKNSASIPQVKKLKFKLTLLDNNKHTDSLKKFKYCALLTPDQSHLDFLLNYSDLFLDGTCFIYAHGFSCTYKNIPVQFSQFGHLLLAPKAIARELRYQYEIKGKLGAVFSLEHSKNLKNDKKYILKLAKSLGINLGPYECTFIEETKADLFSEQSLLCSIIPYGAIHSFNLLRSKNISPYVAYFECFYEMKLIVDSLIEMGPVKFFDLISPNAFIGAQKASKLIFDQEFLNKYKKLWDEIDSNAFIKELDSISTNDYKKLKAATITSLQNEELTQIFKKINKTSNRKGIKRAK